MNAPVVEGAAARVPPLVMVVPTTALGLLPLLWEEGVGADVTARTRHRGSEISGRGPGCRRGRRDQLQG